MTYKGLITDSVITVPVGEVSSDIKHLLKTTKKALKLGIEQAQLGNHVGAIGAGIAWDR